MTVLTDTECSRNILQNIEDIFALMITLNSNQLDISEMSNFKSKVERCIIERVGLVPPCEATITLHELWHICDQVKFESVPRRTNLYKFERMNHFLKTLLKNMAAGASIGFLVNN